MKYQTVIKQVEVQRPVGYWLVRFSLVWNADEDGGGLNDVDEAEVIEITLDTNDADGMDIRDNSDDQHGDTHDFRDRLFETEVQARDHAERTVKRWRNPQVWESFVRV